MHGGHGRVDWAWAEKTDHVVRICIIGESREVGKCIEGYSACVMS